MSRSTIGVCEKTRDGNSRKHVMEPTTDTYGNHYASCKLCGSTPVYIIHQSEEKNEARNI